jgi:hypothetical protein
VPNSHDLTACHTVKPLISCEVRTVKVRLGRALLSAVLLVTIVAPQVSADGLSATLDGKRIRLENVPDLNCHDFDFPVIRCFSTPDLIAGDIAARLAGRNAAGAQLLLAGYVTVYQDAGYGSPSISLSYDQTSLSALGWNDRISSFISHGASGGFWEHSPSGGFYYGYASTTQVSYVGAFYNDKFSAFNIN